MDKCFLCGKEKTCARVECKYGYIRDICGDCYENRINSITQIKVLEAKIKGILFALSDCQRDVAEHYTRQEIEKIAFEDVGE